MLLIKSYNIFIWIIDKTDGKLKLLGSTRSGDRYVIRLEELRKEK